MKKIKLGKYENDLLFWILAKQLEYGWDSCIGGHDVDNKRECRKYEKEMKMVKEIMKKLDN